LHLALSREAIVGGTKNPSIFVAEDQREVMINVKTGSVSTDFVEITEGLRVFRRHTS
jgi:hypothetical protein